MTPPDLSVIIVSWNTCELLRDCLCSLHDQSDGLALEMIVVDNGSTDGSVAMAAAEFPATIIIACADNLGFSAANNLGLDHAHGRYILFLNTDTVVLPGALWRLVTFLDHHPQIGAAGPQLLNADRTLQPSGRPLPTLASAMLAIIPLPADVRQRFKSPQEKRDYGQTALVGELSGAALVVKHEVVDRIGGFDEGFFFLGEDIDLCWRIRQAGWEIAYHPAAKIIHLWGGSSRGLSERHSLLAQRAYFRLLQKHGRPLESILFAVVAVLATILKGGRRLLVAAVQRDWRAAARSLYLHLAELGWLLASGWRRGAH